MQSQSQVQQPAQQMNTELKSLKVKLTVCESSIKRDPNDHSAHNLKGKLLLDRARISGNNQDKNEALSSLTRAVDLDRKNAVYLCDRAELYASMGNSEMAVRDFQTINMLRQTQTGQNILDIFHVNSTLDELAKLSSVKETIQSLRAKKELSTEFLDAFDQLTGVTERLAVTVGDHSSQLNAHSSKLNDHENQFEELRKMVFFLRDKVLNQEEVTDADLKRIKEALSQNKKDIKQMQETIDLSGVKDKAALRQRFKDLEKNDPVLYKYTITFYWTTLNLFQAYRQLSTGKVAADESGSVLIDGVKEVVKMIPGFGGIIGFFTDVIVDKAYGWVQGKKLENKTSIITSIIQKFCPLEDDLSTMIGNLSLVLAAQEGKKIIISQAPLKNTASTASPFQKTRDWISAKCEKKQKELWPAIKTDIHTVQATQDAALMMTYIFVSYETIMAAPEALDVQIDKAFKTDKLNKMFAKMGLAGVCKKCQGWLESREGSMSAHCSECGKSSLGGVKCTPCKIKKCKLCAEKSLLS